MNKASLFLVSTPLHLMVSIAIVDTLNIKNAHLIFIDQVKGRKNPYLETLDLWPDHPFESVAVFFRPERKLLSKLQSRKETFSALEKIVMQLKPKHIYTGNDRRVEFQYSMHVAQKLGCNPVGFYMDEGTFTYVGRKASNQFADKVLDNISKKLAYGLWWKHPATVGASSWIDTVFVSFPDIIHPLLKNKKCQHLTLAYWQSKQLMSFCEHLVTHIGKPLHLAELDVLITLPHESILNANQTYKKQIQQIIETYLQKNCKVGVKYHPRDTNSDLLDLGSIDGVEILSRELPFEALLPMIKSGATVLGDFSTTLISTRLLRPDLIAQAIDHGSNKNTALFVELYKKIGIQIV
jgi:hypothetical protein